MRKQRVTLSQFAQFAVNMYNGRVELTTKEIKSVSQKHDVLIPGEIWKNVVKRGLFSIGDIEQETVQIKVEESETNPKPKPEQKESVVVIEKTEDRDSYVPKVNPLYVPNGLFTDSLKIVKSGIFFPTFITGLSGNGKTLGLEQVCAKLKRKFFRVNITTDTDEDDLMGGFRLVDGNTVWQNGPVVDAMLEGGVLVLDEIDLGTPKIMCLQSILEGNGYYIKKLSKWVEPVKGFQIFATANTKGKGSEHDQFIGTNILNEAFLDRFSATIYQKYPSKAIETKILTRSMEHYFGKVGEEEIKFINNLVQWSDIIRSTFDSGGIDEIVTTRRLVDITKSYSIFNNKVKSVKLAVERFEEVIGKSFLELYAKIDDGVELDQYGGLVEEDIIEDAEEASPF